jgi:chlorite dismutase
MKNYFQKKLSLSISILLLLLFISFSASSEPYNYREVWNSWTDYQRYIYLWGFNDARENIWGDISNIIKEFEESEELSIYDIKKIIDLTNKIDLTEISANITDYEELNVTFDSPDLKVIRDVMTELYKDPANSYISFKSMVFFATDKLEGKSIESGLTEKRKSIKESEIKMQELLTK